MSDGSRLIPARDILITADVRRLAGGISRHTLIYWRRHKGFPEPVKQIRVGRGKRMRYVDIYDRRDVRAWLKANPATGTVKPGRY